MTALFVALLLSTQSPEPPAPEPAPAATVPPPVLAAIPQDSPEEIARDAARDLKDSRFYNRAGATREDYNQEWQDCRLIARGSRSPSGQTIFVPYNPAVISPLAAGAAAGLGSIIASAIQEGEMRRANRRTCLMVKGWALVEVEDAEERARVAALPDAEKEALFNRYVGAETLPEGTKVTRWTNSFASPDLAPEKDQ